MNTTGKVTSPFGFVTCSFYLTYFTRAMNRIASMKSDAAVRVYDKMLPASSGAPAAIVPNAAICPDITITANRMKSAIQNCTFVINPISPFAIPHSIDAVSITTYASRTMTNQTFTLQNRTNLSEIIGHDNYAFKEKSCCWMFRYAPVA